jgi:hypothetical protein
MEQIEQLKAMRDAARARIEAMPDHRLMTSLTALIEDLESAFGGRQSAPREQAASADAAPQDDQGQEPEPAQATQSFEPEDAPQETAQARQQPDEVEETVVIVETMGEDDPEEIDLMIAPEEIENLIAAEVVSMNGNANGSDVTSLTEDAVNRALDELSIDLADSLGSEPAGIVRR